MSSISTGESLALSIGRYNTFSATIVGASRKYTCMNWLGRKCVHASPDLSRYRSISSCMRTKRNFPGSKLMPDSGPGKLNDLFDASLFASVDERALGFHHPRV